MGLTLADQYYLKALDNYHYDLTETVESLNYALSYNKNHTDAICLMGRVYNDYLNKPKLAIQYFEEALSNDLENIEVLRNYISLLLNLEEYEKAEKLIQYGLTIKGGNKGVFLYFKAKLEEHKHNYKKAKNNLKKSLLNLYYESDRNFVKTELNRVKDKIKETKSKNKYRKKRSKCSCKKCTKKKNK